MNQFASPAMTDNSAALRHGEGPLGNGDPIGLLKNFSPLIRKLGALAHLTTEEISFMEGLQINRTDVLAGTDFVIEEEDFTSTFILRQGWANRYRTLVGGRRQILSFLLPGDVIGLNVNFRRRATYSVAAHTNCELALVEPMRTLEIQQKFPILASALSWLTVREYAILAEHAVRLGRRSAYERTVHLLLELYNRLSMIGETDGSSYTLPFSQEDLGDALGLSLVHVNRTLRRLKNEGALDINKKQVVLREISHLVEIADMPSAFLEDFAVL